MDAWQGEPPANASMGSMISEALRLDRDQIRGSVDGQELYGIQMQIVERVQAMEPVIFNSHLAARHGGVVGVNIDFERALHPSHYVVITAEPSQIAQWRAERNRRGERDSEVEDVAIVAAHQEILTGAVHAIARQIDARVMVVNNAPGDIDDNVHQILNFLESL